MKKLYPFQEGGVARILGAFDRGRENGPKGIFLADEMGLGKTVQVARALSSLPGNSAVIAPASLVPTWLEELEDSDVKAARFPKIARCTVGSYGDAPKMCCNAKLEHLTTLVVDEAHLVKNHEAVRTQWVHELAKRALFRIPVTGTPIFNHPRDLWTNLILVNPGLWGPPDTQGFLKFAARYCDSKKVFRWFGKRRVEQWDHSGAANLLELREKMEPEMLRRTKAAVLPQLPDKVRQVVSLPSTGNERVERKLVRFDDALFRKWSEPGLFAQLAELRHQTAREKIPHVLDYIAEVLEGREKIVVFAYHVDIVEGLRKRLDRYGVACITEKQTPEQRHAAAKEFQTGSARILLGSLVVASAGFTLTAADLMLFVELSFNPGEMLQAEDRIHRIGQSRSVLIQYAVTERSIDEHVARLLVKKQGVIEEVFP